MFVVQKEICVDCGSSFEISFEEIKHKREHGMKPPKRCKDCRKKIVTILILTEEYIKLCTNIQQQKDIAITYTAVSFNFERSLFYERTRKLRF